MNVRRIVFLLFLYIALAWVVVFLLYAELGGAVVIKQGCLWTAIGLGAVLLWHILQHVFGWWKARQVRARAATPPPAVAKDHEDDVAFAGLIAEADSKLARAHGEMRRGVRDYPIYLLVGPPGAGKTSLIRDAGIDARLLAGQVSDGVLAVPTRVANIWLVNECVFIELSGRLFQSDTRRLGEFLRVLLPQGAATGWRSLWNNSAARPLQLRGVVLCQDLREFLKARERAAVESNTHSLRGRVLTIAEVFSVKVPVYTIFTNADAIPFFADFFGRLSESDAGQAFGVLAATQSESANKEERAWADAEGRRLTRDFNSLFLCLNARRLLTLSQEPLRDRKPAIYEFPREFKRLRSPVVQFLVDSLQPDPLAVSPLSRGFFFCGRRQLATDAELPSDTIAHTVPFSPEATRIFKPDATVIFGTGQREEKGRQGSVFTKEFFQTVLRNDQPEIAPQAKTGHALIRRRRTIVAAVAGMAAVLMFVWTVSWVGNRSLVHEVTESFRISSPGRNLSLANLRALDNLRGLLAEELDRPHSLWIRWGLYTGDGLREGVRTAYFNRLRQILLADANAFLVDRLLRLRNGSYDEQYDTAYRELKTHVTIAQSGCAVDAPLLSGTLLQAIGSIHPEMDEPQRALVGRQIDFYLRDLAKENPVRLRADTAAIQNTRAYLIAKKGPEQIYAALLSEIRKGASKILVRDSVGDFKDAMSAPENVAFEFTKEGHARFDQLIDSGKLSAAGEQCVLGTASRAGEAVATIEQARKVKALYFREYANFWKDFLDHVKFRGYRGDPADAAAKLEILSRPDSPLLSVIKLVGENTFFPSTTPAAAPSTIVEKAKNAFNKAKKQVEKGAEQSGIALSPEFGPSNVSAIFQPVHLTAQPDSQSLITEKNTPYVKGLRSLQEAADALARSTVSAPVAERAQLITMLEAARTQALDAERNLADGFFQDTEGVDKRTAEILLEPIRDLKVPAKPDPTGERNKELSRMCLPISATLAKYPFSPQSANEAALSDVANLFAPETGLTSKYQKAVGDLLVKTGSHWEPKPDAGAGRVSPDLLDFLNRSQDASDAFFPAGAQQPRLEYSLRPVPQQLSKLKLQINGQTMNAAASAFQVDFRWPGPDPSLGAEASIVAGDQESGIGKYSGLWGAFKLFRNADPRGMKANQVTWSRILGVGGDLQQLKPPVKVEIIKFPNGMDVFNPAFFSSLRCPARAIIAEER